MILTGYLFSCILLFKFVSPNIDVAFDDDEFLFSNDRAWESVDGLDLVQNEELHNVPQQTPANYPDHYGIRITINDMAISSVLDAAFEHAFDPKLDNLNKLLSYLPVIPIRIAGDRVGIDIKNIKINSVANLDLKKSFKYVDGGFVLHIQDVALDATVKLSLSFKSMPNYNTDLEIDAKCNKLGLSVRLVPFFDLDPEGELDQRRFRLKLEAASIRFSDHIILEPTQYDNNKLFVQLFTELQKLSPGTVTFTANKAIDWFVNPVIEKFVGDLLVDLINDLVEFINSRLANYLKEGWNSDFKFLDYLYLRNQEFHADKHSITFFTDIFFNFFQEEDPITELELNTKFFNAQPPKDWNDELDQHARMDFFKAVEEAEEERKKGWWKRFKNWFKRIFRRK